MNCKQLFFKSFNKNANMNFSCGGRIEILGNHTDHNHGLCLVLTCALCIEASVNVNNNNIINFVSQGYPCSTIDLNNLDVIKGEDKSAAMIRGVANYLVNHGYRVGGFDIACTSTIFPGAGISSSAAFELLIGQIFNVLFNDGMIDKLFLCKAGQYSENNYFGKKSGLLDQIGVAYGNLIAIDFANINQPKIENIVSPFSDLHFVIVNTGGDHSSLNDLYSSIPNDMFSAARKMGHEFLNECKYEDIFKVDLNAMEKSRSIHFFSENERVKKAVEAIKNNDEQSFLDAINESRASSTNNLHNMMVNDLYAGSPLEACDYAMKIMDNDGACKINGGGFAGSIICFVKDKYLNNFIEKMSSKYGKGNVAEAFIRHFGPIKVDN